MIADDQREHPEQKPAGDTGSNAGADTAQWRQPQFPENQNIIQDDIEGQGCQIDLHGKARAAQGINEGTQHGSHEKGDDTDADPCQVIFGNVRNLRFQTQAPDKRIQKTEPCCKT